MIRSSLSSGSRRRCDRTVGGARTFVRRDACAFSIVPPASRCGPGSGVLSRSCQEGARRERVDPNYALIRQQIIVVGDQRPFRRCAQRCDFSIVPIPDEDKDASPPTQPVTAARIPIRYEKSGLGSTGPANSPSGWKRLRLPPSRGAEFGVGSSRSRFGWTGSRSSESVRPRTRALGARPTAVMSPSWVFLGSVGNDDPVSLLTYADAHHQCLQWVTGGKTPSEYILSELPQLADIVRRVRRYSASPLVLRITAFWVRAIPR